ncbi:MAG: leucine-rich repeat protein [Clostridia bacterium]|nr:leucine-rich repeat protein [Clostridia bacterium]
MKKILAVICVLAMLLTVASFTTSAYGEIQKGDWTYKLNENGDAVITSVNKDISGEVVIPASIDEYSVAEIGDSAFLNCNKITGVVIPDSVDTIGNQAFFSCTDLQRVELGENVIKIGEQAFYQCGALSEVVFNDKLEIIGKMAFYECQKLKEVNFPDSLKVIEEQAFSNCTNLRSLDLNKVESLGEGAFLKCTGLKELIIPDSIETMGVNAFKNCKNIKHLVIGRGVSTIPNFAFAGVKNLEKIFIYMDNLNVIEDDAFNISDTYFSGMVEHKVTDIFFSGTEEDWDDVVVNDKCNDIFFDENVEKHFEASYDEHTFDEEKEPATTVPEPTVPETSAPASVGLLGDVNGDGKVNIKDATTIQKSAAKILTLSDKEVMRADVNADTKVNVKDATAIQKYLAKIETGFNIGVMI